MCFHFFQVWGVSFPNDIYNSGIALPSSLPSLTDIHIVNTNVRKALAYTVPASVTWVEISFNSNLEYVPRFFSGDSMVERIDFSHNDLGGDLDSAFEGATLPHLRSLNLAGQTGEVSIWDVSLIFNRKKKMNRLAVASYTKRAMSV